MSGSDPDHRPSASRRALAARAEILSAIRDFFRGRGVLEVETPLLCAAGAIDEHLDPIAVTVRLPGSQGRRFLVTSPEHSMKRLLAAGSGPIYQIARAFRDGERGRLHNPEFTILEWYRPGFDVQALMDEVELLVSAVLGDAAARPFERITYREAFQRACGIDPHSATLEELARLVRAGGGGNNATSADRDALLNELLVTRVEPALGAVRPAFLHDYPASQASSGCVRAGVPPVAERFELYVRGIELANGYRELLDPAEQRVRYEQAARRRGAAGKAALPMDERLLAALRDGLPAGAGVALGVDRMVMIALGAAGIDEVIAFPIERA